MIAGRRRRRWTRRRLPVRSRPMRRRLCAWLSVTLFACGGQPAGVDARAPQPARPGSSTGTTRVAPAGGHAEAAAQVESAIDAMGGRARLAQVKTLRADVVANTLLMEQSYRQAPFFTSYERDHVTLDVVGHRLRREAHSVWPE